MKKHRHIFLKFRVPKLWNKLENNILSDLQLSQGDSDTRS